MANNYTVIWAQTASEDLLEIIQFIKLDNPLAAKNTLKRIKEKLLSLESFPQRGQVVPELKDSISRINHSAMENDISNFK